VSCTKTAEPIEMPFGTWTRVGPGKNVLDGDAHWHHTANTAEPFTCRGDAAFSSNYSEHLFKMTEEELHRIKHAYRWQIIAGVVNQ